MQRKRVVQILHEIQPALPLPLVTEIAVPTTIGVDGFGVMRKVKSRQTSVRRDGDNVGSHFDPAVERAVFVRGGVKIAERDQGTNLHPNVPAGAGPQLVANHNAVLALDHENRFFDLHAIHVKYVDRKRIEPEFAQKTIPLRVDDKRQIPVRGEVEAPSIEDYGFFEL